MVTFNSTSAEACFLQTSSSASLASEAALNPEAIEARLISFVYKAAQRYRGVRFKKGSVIYSAGERDRAIYCLEEGTVRISISTFAGRSCLLYIHRAPMFFGEVSRANGERADMAVARTDVLVRKIPGAAFAEMLKEEDAAHVFATFLAARLAEHQQIITDFVTYSAEERLAAVLLRIGRRLGRMEAGELCFQEPISCQELSEMVGTTRSRIGYFLGRLRERDILSVGAACRFKIRERLLTEYLCERA